MLLQFILVVCGSAAGGALRYAVSLLGRSYPASFPWPTFAVNVVGSFAIGALAATLGAESERYRLLLITGFCGGFTTFSAFSMETFALIEKGSWGLAMANVALSVVCAVGACALGYVTAR